MVDIPLHCLVVLVGTCASGKTSWAQKNFADNEILSPEKIRLELFGRVNNFQHESLVWKEIYRRAEQKLLNGSRVVVDSPNLKRSDRDPFEKIAATAGVACVALIFSRDQQQRLATLTAQGLSSADALSLLGKQDHTFRTHERSLANPAGCLQVYPVDHIDRVCQPLQTLEHQLLAVGDVHGDFGSMQRAVALAKSKNLQIVWLGDVVDYGRDNLKCVRLAYETVVNNSAVMIWGNHERKISKWIDSNWGERYSGRLSEANTATVDQILSLNPERRQRFLSVWRALENHSQQFWRSNNWLFTHGAAGPQVWQTPHCHRLTGSLGEMAYFGQTDKVNPTRSDGYPNRVWDWVNSVPENHNVVVGHDWVDRTTNRVVTKRNNNGGTVYCVDAGNSKGGRLAAMQIDTLTQKTEEWYFDT